jgi:hypothetical protein
MLENKQARKYIYYKNLRAIIISSKPKINLYKTSLKTNKRGNIFIIINNTLKFLYLIFIKTILKV